MSPEGTLRAERVWKRFHADPTAGELRDRLARLGRRSDAGWRWALQDVSLRAEPGDSLALIGANGSGKSTLLKILSRVMYPYAGSVSVAGRVGALIEVKAGLHPDLSGRENVYLYGNLLGLKRRDVARRFDDIIDFAELETAVDRPLKYYSSGMQMRLGFGVAAFLEPDVLLVDEVLAVGDATFQQRCLDRMRSVLAQGTTLVFVSHDLAAVEAMCAQAVWLDGGEVAASGNIDSVLQGYRTWVEQTASSADAVAGVIRATKATASAPGGATVRTGEDLVVTLRLDSPEAMGVKVCIGLSEGTASPAILVHRNLHLGAGETEVRCTLAHLPLPRGRWYVWLGVFAKHRELLAWHPTTWVDVQGPDLAPATRGIVRPAPIYVDSTWEDEPQ